MLKNYWLLAWRNLVKSRLHSLLNITGLSIGMTVSFILFLYVYNEYSFDKFHGNHTQLFQVFKNQSANGVIKTKAFTPEPLAAALRKDIPEVARTARVYDLGKSLLSYQEKGIKVPAVAADASLAEMFTFEWLAGNRQPAAIDASAIILTRSTAIALFGETNPVGKIIKLNNQFPLTVKAVIADNPANSSFTFKALLPWESFAAQQPWIKDVGWGNYLMDTYVQLRPGASPDVVNARVKPLIARYAPGDKDISLFIYPLDRLHLYNQFQNGVNTGGRIEYVRLFFFLAIGILLVACINFMNLATARSEKRAREVGVRKTMGAHRLSLIGQFLVESLLMAGLALLFAIVLTTVLLPFFNRLTGLQLAMPFGNAVAWLAALGITLATGLLAGSWPAFFLSSFNPVRVLKGQIAAAGSTVKPRQVLVIAQFSFAIGLIVSSLFIYKQLDFIKDRSSGYDRNGLVEIPLDGKLNAQFESFRRDAIASGAVTDAALTSASITENKTAVWDVRWPGQLSGEEKIPIDCMGATGYFLDTYGLQLTRGRDFDPARPADSVAVIMNEASIKLMRLKEPLGQKITWQGIPRTVVGVVKDFVWGSPFEPVKPAMILFQKDWTGNIGLRLNPNASIAKSLAVLQTVYRKYNPEYPFEYSFTDENFAKKFDNEKLLGTISIGFTGLAILISCLGLFGLASFSAEQRRKEIGIRKVLGATTGGLWLRLSREFILLVGIAFLIGSIGSGWYVHHWLDSYTYHTGMTIGIFIATGAISMIIGLLAVSYQTLRAANANPAKSIMSSL